MLLGGLLEVPSYTSPPRWQGSTSKNNTNTWCLDLSRSTAGEIQAVRTGNFLVFDGFVHSVICSVCLAEGNSNGLFSGSFPWSSCQKPPDRI